MKGRALAAALALTLTLTFASFDCASRVPPAATPAPVLTAPSPTPTPMLEEGTTIDSAIVVEASDERSGVDWENDWIYRHYGRFRKTKVNLLDAGGRRYDAIEVELADSTKRTIYFDITSFFGR